MPPLKDKSNNITMASRRRQSANNLGSTSNSVRTVASKNSDGYEGTSGNSGSTSGAKSTKTVSSMEKKKGTRAQPNRQCKGKLPKNDITATEINDKSKANKLDIKKNQTRRITRAARKLLLENLKKAVKAAENAKRRPCLRISRTVELVNQKDGSWREEKSKLIFMLSLGLTPIFESPAISSTPQVKLSTIPNEMLPMARTNWDGEQAESSTQLMLKSRRKLRREKRAQIIREQAQRFLPSSRPTEIEFIDLSEDGENHTQISTEKIDDTFSLSSFNSIFDDDVIVLD